MSRGFSSLYYQCKLLAKRHGMGRYYPVGRSGAMASMRWKLSTRFGQYLEQGLRVTTDESRVIKFNLG